MVGMNMMQTDGSLNGRLVERNESASIVNLPHDGQCSHCSCDGGKTKTSGVE